MIVILHGNHGDCERNSTPEPTMPPPPPGVDLRQRFMDPWYARTGSCDDPNTDTFDESVYYDVVPNHRGYDYLGQKLASHGYIVVSINANRGIHIGNVPGTPDPALILPRANLVLRHMQKLREWNNCTTNPACQTPASLGVDLRSKLDFTNVGLLGHSRGGQAVRASYNKYKETGSVWQSRIPGLSIKGIFEIGPTDFETNTGIIANPASKFVVNGTKWNILLPMCDSDVFSLVGMNSYDRTLLSLSSDNPATQKSTFTVQGANHNFYNTVWNYHDLGFDSVGDYRCVGHDPLWTVGAIGSEKQRQTAISSVVAFVRANVGNTTVPNYNQNFDPRFESPSAIQNITRVERGFTPSPNSTLTTVFEDFSGLTIGTVCPSVRCTMNGAGVSNVITNILPYHDESLNVLRVNWTTPGSDRSIQINRTSSINVVGHQTLDFRISRVPDTAVPSGLNVSGGTNLSVQLAMADGTLSNAVKLCTYAYVDGPSGGFDPLFDPSGQSIIGIAARKRPLLQTVRVPLDSFTTANFSQIRGIKITFDESDFGSIFLTNFRFTK